jgi:hypothetical protein
LEGTRASGVVRIPRACPGDVRRVLVGRHFKSDNNSPGSPRVVGEVDSDHRPTDDCGPTDDCDHYDESAPDNHDDNKPR